MAELIVTKSGPQTLVVMPEFEEEFKKVGDGELLRVKYTRPRNLKFHRKAFALMQLGFENQAFYATFEQFRTALLIGLGWCETFIRANGEVLYIPKSLAFESMDETEFTKVYNDLLNHLVTVMIPGTDPAMMSAEAGKILSFL